MQVLVLNSGSSSIKFSVFAVDEAGARPEALLEGEASGLGTDAAALTARDVASGNDRTAGTSLRRGDGADAASRAIAQIISGVDGPGRAGVTAPNAVGYRVVHPGPRIKEHCALTPAVLAELKAAAEFAPLHQPPMLHLMEEIGKQMPLLPAFCCFDTVFHETMPEEASVYALPETVRARGVRRYGFHGISCEGVVAALRGRAGQTHGQSMPRRLVVAHLGSGCSVTAILDGQSIENSMGLTPDGGVVMGTRPGDLDPGVVLYLLRQAGDPAKSVAEVESMLNRDAGVHALSGMPNDMRAVRKAAGAGDGRAALAVRVFARSVRKALGSAAALLGGIDALVFTGGIGEHDAAGRAEILEGMAAFGLELDSRRNQQSEADALGFRTISPQGATAEVLVIAADEDRTIARHVLEMMLRP